MADEDTTAAEKEAEDEAQKRNGIDEIRDEDVEVVDELPGDDDGS